MSNITRSEFTNLTVDLARLFEDGWAQGIDLRTVFETHGFCLVRREPTNEDLEVAFKAEPVPSMRASKEHYRAAIKKYIERYE